MKKHCKHMLAIMLMAVMAMAVLTGCGRKNKIDLRDEKYVSVNISGPSGYGEASVDMDDDALAAMILSDDVTEENLTAYLLKIDALSRITYTLDKTDKLSNGDTVTVTVTYPEELEEVLDAKITPKSGDSWTVEVTGLEELYTFDLFLNIDVTFTGFNGYGEPKVQVNGGNNVGCIFSQKENLSNGDVVTVTLTGPKGRDLIDYCISEGFVPEVESKEFIVSGLPEVPQIDLFENLDVTVQGRSPFLSLAIRGKYDGIQYEIPQNGQLKSGDAVTIRAYTRDYVGETDLAQHCLSAFNGVPVTDTYTYTIPEQQEYYLMQQEQLTQEILKQAISKAEDLFEAQTKSVEIQDVKYDRYYLKTTKDDVRERDCCHLYIVHEVKYSFEGSTYTAYNVVCFNDAYVDMNGQLRSAEEVNIYKWFWESGVEDLNRFEQEHIVPYQADYDSVSGK